MHFPSGGIPVMNLVSVERRQQLTVQRAKRLPLLPADCVYLNIHSLAQVACITNTYNRLRREIHAALVTHAHTIYTMIMSNFSLVFGWAGGQAGWGGQAG
jgi:hypothetical protein